MSERINILYEDDPRMDAYYYTFKPTGEKSIDAILSAVAWAGKGAHNTVNWDEPDGWEDYGPCDPGQTPVDVIQETAKRAAATLQRVRDVHTIDEYTVDRPNVYCLACECLWPCPTIQALDGGETHE